MSLAAIRADRIRAGSVTVPLVVAVASMLGPVGAGAEAGLPCVVPAEGVGMSTERLERIGEGMRRLIAEDKIPGTVTLVARRGKVVHFEANGMRDVAAGRPMEKDTIFRLYSQTKPVTGAAVMMLFEEGRFLLTDPVGEYLPEFADMRVYVGDEDGRARTEPARRMTIQHLLTHTSGLTYDFFQSPVAKMYRDAGVMGSAADARHPDLRTWSESLARLPLVAQPGTEWNYSVGMDVLGRLIEVVSGRSFGEFLASRIFEPLGMQDTGFHVPDDKLSRFAANYGPKPGGGSTSRSPRSIRAVLLYRGR